MNAPSIGMVVLCFLAVECLGFGVCLSGLLVDLWRSVSIAVLRRFFLAGLGVALAGTFVPLGAVVWRVLG